MLDLQIGPASIGETTVNEERLGLFVGRQIVRQADRRMVARDPERCYVCSQIIAVHDGIVVPCRLYSCIGIPLCGAGPLAG